MNNMTATVLLWSALGVSYQWPHLRTTAQKLLGWVFGIPSAVFLATISCGFLANLLLATVPWYFVEFQIRFDQGQSAPPLVQRLMATADLKPLRNSASACSPRSLASASSPRTRHKAAPPWLAKLMAWR